MTEDEAAAGPATAPSTGKRKDRDFLTNGLKQIYDPVLDEPLPDNILKLLSQLDGGK